MEDRSTKRKISQKVCVMEKCRKRYVVKNKDIKRKMRES